MSSWYFPRVFSTVLFLCIQIRDRIQLINQAAFDKLIKEHGMKPEQVRDWPVIVDENEVIHELKLKPGLIDAVTYNALTLKHRAVGNDFHVEK